MDLVGFKQVKKEGDSIHKEEDKRLEAFAGALLINEQDLGLQCRTNA